MSELVTVKHYGVDDLGEERLRLIVDSVVRAMPTDAIVIFGSFARGEATDDSDVDILVLSPLRGIELRNRSVEAESRMWDLDKRTDFLAYNTGDFAQMINSGWSFASNVVRDGVCVYGQFEQARELRRDRRG